MTSTPRDPVDLRVDVFVDGRSDLIFNFGAAYQREVIGGATRELAASNLDGALQPLLEHAPKHAIVHRPAAMPDAPAMVLSRQSSQHCATLVTREPARSAPLPA